MVYYICTKEYLQYIVKKTRQLYQNKWIIGPVFSNNHYHRVTIVFLKLELKYGIEKKVNDIKFSSEIDIKTKNNLKKVICGKLYMKKVELL